MDAAADWFTVGFLLGLFSGFFFSMGLSPAPDHERLLQQVPPADVPVAERLSRLHAIVRQQARRVAAQIAGIWGSALVIITALVTLAERLSPLQGLLAFVLLCLPAILGVELFAAIYLFVRSRSVRLRIEQDARLRTFMDRQGSE